nr:hypothetical protein [Tanacetum cinerariifolium]
MSFSTISISSNTTDESIGLSASLVILSDIETELSPSSSELPLSSSSETSSSSPEIQVPHPITSIVASGLSPLPADRLPPRKRFRGSAAISFQDATTEAMAEPDIPLIHHG